jgi:hypothetical protein
MSPVDRSQIGKKRTKEDMMAKRASWPALVAVGIVLLGCFVASSSTHPARAAGLVQAAAADTTPPSITNIRESANPIYRQGCSTPNTVTFRADVWDADGLEFVRLSYGAPAGSWTWVFMTLESGSTYAATVGPFAATGTLSYQVKAQDLAGNPAQSIIDTVTVIDCGGTRGDVNGDGLADSTDALIILSADVAVATPQFCPMNCGDANADGLVNSTDALLVLSYDAGMSVPFPVGQSGCPSSVTQPAGCNP